MTAATMTTTGSGGGGGVVSGNANDGGENSLSSNSLLAFWEKMEEELRDAKKTCRAVVTPAVLKVEPPPTLPKPSKVVEELQKEQASLSKPGGRHGYPDDGPLPPLFFFLAYSFHY